MHPSLHSKESVPGVFVMVVKVCVGVAAPGYKQEKFYVLSCCVLLERHRAEHGTHPVLRYDSSCAARGRVSSSRAAAATTAVCRYIGRLRLLV